MMLYLRIISILSIHLIPSSRHQISSKKPHFVSCRTKRQSWHAGRKMSLIKGNVARLSEDILCCSTAARHKVHRELKIYVFPVALA